MSSTTSQEYKLGEIAYNAYCARVGWKSVRGERLPTFVTQKPEVASAWIAAAKAVADEYVYAWETREVEKLRSEVDRLEDENFDLRSEIEELRQRMKEAGVK